MALLEEFERSGHWLFRWRSYLPLLLFGPALLGFRDLGYPGGSHTVGLLWEVLCLAVALAGLAVRVVTTGHAPAGTSGRNTHEGQVAEALNTTGMYSVVRHPLYLGNYFMSLGLALFPRAAWLPVVVSLCFWLYYERIMFAEEAFLRRKYGAAFEAWAARTPAFVPNPNLWRRPDLPFSLRTVLKREYSGLLGVVTSFAMFDLVEDLAATGSLMVDPFWLAAFTSGAVSCGSLRYLKRRTGMLRVPGR